MRRAVKGGLRRFGPGPYLLGLRRDVGSWGSGFPFDVPAMAAIDDLRQCALRARYGGNFALARRSDCRMAPSRRAAPESKEGTRWGGFSTRSAVTSGAAGMAEVAAAEADAGGTAYDRRGSYTRTTVSWLITRSMSPKSSASCVNTGIPCAIAVAAIAASNWRTRRPAARTADAIAA